MSAAGDMLTAVRVIASLLAVVALALLAARLARRASVRAGTRSLRVVQRLALSREAALAVVEVGGRGLVLGVTSHGVTAVAELTPPELESLRGDPGADGGARIPPEGRVHVRQLPDGGAGTLARLAPPASRRPAGTGTGSVLDPRTWRQGVESLRDLTARRR